MNEIELKLYFQGANCFVLNPDETKSMTGVVINGRLPRLASNGQPHVYHQPTLSCDLEDTVELPDLPISYQTGGQGKRRMLHWVLNGDELVINQNNQPLAGKQLQVRRDGSERDISFIPTMNKIYRDRQGLNIKDRCLTDPDLHGVGLAARIKLTAGRFSAYPGEHNEFLTSEEFTFTHMPISYRQRLAACALFETELAANYVEIFSRQLGRGIKLRPAHGKTVELTISNTPPFGLEMAKPGNDEADLDFEMVYQLASEIPPQLRIPARIMMGPEYPQPLMCTPAIFNPHVKA